MNGKLSYCSTYFKNVVLEDGNYNVRRRNEMKREMNNNVY